MAEKGPKKFSRFMRHFPTTFVASGYFCIFYSPLDLPSLKSIELGRCAFAFSIATVIEGIVYY